MRRWPIARWSITSALVACISATVVPGLHAAATTATDRVDVVTSLYPIAFAAQRVGGTRIAVANLTPTGAEPHDLELTTKQVDQLLDADVALVVGGGFQPAVERTANQRDGTTVAVRDALPTGKDSDDPHVWLDPVLMRDIVDQIRRALTRADPSGRATYQRNADTLSAKLDDLDARYRAGFAHCTRELIVTAHEAFGHLARRYGLREEGVAGLSPDAEPDARRIAELADLARREGATVVFTERLLSPRIARTLAREAGARTEVLDPLEGLDATLRADGASYLSVMDQNLRKLRSALGCS